MIQSDKPIISRDNINVLLDSNRENLYESDSGLGFRASLPKMPSFRRKKIPSPVPEDDDEEDDIRKSLSDNEEIVHYSDSEAATKSQEPSAGSATVATVRHRERKDSTSSNGSSSSFSSSSDSDSSDECSSDSETEAEVKQINRRSATPNLETPSVETKVQVEQNDIIDVFSPLRTGIEPSNKTPEPMQVSNDVGTNFVRYLFFIGLC